MSMWTETIFHISRCLYLSICLCIHIRLQMQMCDSIKTVEPIQHIYESRHMRWGWKNIREEKVKKADEERGKTHLPKWKREHESFLFAFVLCVLLLDSIDTVSRVFFYGYLERKFYTFLRIWCIASCEFSQPAKPSEFSLEHFCLPSPCSLSPCVRCSQLVAQMY